MPRIYTIHSDPPKLERELEELWVEADRMRRLEEELRRRIAAVESVLKTVLDRLPP